MIDLKLVALSVLIGGAIGLNSSLINEDTLTYYNDQLTEDYLNKERVFKAETYDKYHLVGKFDNATQVTGATLKNHIAKVTSNDLMPKLVLVQFKDSQGLLNSFGYRINIKGSKDTFDLEEVFGLHADSVGLGMLISEDMHQSEYAREMIEFHKSSSIGDSNKLNMYFSHPSYKNDVQLMNGFHLTNYYDRHKISDLDPSQIDDDSQYLTTFIYSDTGGDNLIGVYFEEYGIDIQRAPLAYKMYSNKLIDIREDYLGINLTPLKKEDENND